MNISDYLNAMQPFIERREWADLETEYKRVATELAGSEIAETIAAIYINGYETELRSAMQMAYSKAQEASYKAI